MVATTPSERSRLLILLQNRENHRVLSETLADRFDITTSFVPSIGDGTEPDGPFDLCILDAESFRQHFRALVRVRERYAPLFLPVLLLADRQTTDVRAGPIWTAIDDILYRPVERIELVARVQSLLRTRRLSLQARRLTTLYEHEHAVAQRLQEAALPRLPPTLPGLVFDAVYRPADDAARVGGDWYDALRLEDGRVVVTIGDVSGSGLDAAVTMSQMRQVLRAVAHVHSDPALMLDAAERTLAGQPEHKQITVFVGVIDTITSEITYASAGHPPPMILAADGSIEILPCDGLLLGTPIRLPRDSSHYAFPEGSMLVLYTDGVTEATRDAVEGEQLLQQRLMALTREETHPAVVIADAMRQPNNVDDVAIVTICHTSRSERGVIYRWEFDATDNARAKDVQREFRVALQGRDVSSSVMADAETIFAELLGNVVRHTKGEAFVALDLEHDAPVLHVLDRGPGFQYFPKLPTDLLSERGRGLFIVSRLTGDFSISRRTGGGSHARVVLA